MSIQLRDGLANQPLDLVLEDLLVRFLVNVPDEDLLSIERVFFQVEEAQWFYTDYVRVLNPLLPAMRMKGFAPKFLKKCPLIWKWGEPADAIARFGKYKSTIPVRGVALFNHDLTKVVLVQGIELNTWSFPRGKISKDELDLGCAIREVREETGFDATAYTSEDDYIERTIRAKNYKIYLAKGVPEDFDFQPQAKNEISQIAWHDIKAIQKKCQLNPNYYFIVGAIIKPILSWISRQRGVGNEQELKLQAEAKLKQLLGISAPVATVSATGIDAGRELLNILQGVKPTAPEQGAVLQLPSSFEVSQYAPPSLLQAGTYAPYVNGYAYTPQPQHSQYSDMLVPPMTQADTAAPKATHASSIPTDSIPQPNPESFQKPTLFRKSSEANPKELLSILKGGLTKSKKPVLLKRPDQQQSHHQQQQQSQHQQQQQPQQQPQQPQPQQQLPPPSIYSPYQASNELEESINVDRNANPAKNKVVLLRRQPDQTNSSTNEILRLLNAPKQEKTNTTLEPAKEILQILRKPETVASPTINAHSSSHASSELLGLLGKPPRKISQSGSAADVSSPVAVATASTIVSPTPVHMAPTHIPTTTATMPNIDAATDGFENFEDFEDFEDYNSSDHHYHASNANNLFEVDSEDEYAEPHANLAPTTKVFNPMSQDFQSIYGAASTTAPSTLLAQPTGQSNLSASNDLLNLLGKRPLQPKPLHLADIEQHQQPQPPQMQHKEPLAGYTTTSSNPLLDMLRKPSQAGSNGSPATAASNSNGSASARDLLSILKGEQATHSAL